MKKRLVLLVLGPAVVLTLCAQLAFALAGPGPADPQDRLPAWAPDGVHLSVQREAPSFQRTLTTTSAGKATFVAHLGGVLRGYLGSKLLIQSGTTTLVTEGGRFAGAPVVLPGTLAAGSPDGSRVAYVRGNDLYVANTDGSQERHVSAGVAPPPGDLVGPVWSPNGSRIVAASAGGLVLANTDGSGSRVLVHGDITSPTWSPDGATVAYQQVDEPYDAIWAVDVATGAPHRVAGGAANYRFPQYSPVSGTLAFISDRQRVPGEASRYRYALYTLDPLGATRKLVDDVHPLSPPRWSPTAALLAVAAGQECRRWGVYVVRSGGGTPHRVSNICRFDSTRRADTIRGSEYFDRINGLGGNDVIRGLGGSDAIHGNNGNDTILAGAGNDFVLAGPGDDVVFGGPGNDVIVPGNGRDRVDCGAGIDTVQGAGPRDRIARNCEHVRR